MPTPLNVEDMNNLLASYPVAMLSCGAQTSLNDIRMGMNLSPVGFDLSGKPVVIAANLTGYWKCLGAHPARGSALYIRVADHPIL